MVMIYTVMNRLLFVMCMAGMLFLSSCSIKEDRDGCPCWMTVEMPDRVGHDGDQVGNGESVVLRLRGNSNEDAVDYEYQVTEEVRAFVGALEYEVPRGSVGVSAVNSVRTAIPVGEQMDSLYGFFKMYHTRCESVLCDVELHKEFCTVSFTLGDEGYSSPYDIEVWSNVAGVSAWDLMPVQGIFRYIPKQEDGVYNVRVPRQIDNSLELVLLGDKIDGQTGNDGKQVGLDGRSPVRAGQDGERYRQDGEKVVVERFPLGEYITRSGYDWSAESLADVSVNIDMASQQVAVSVSDWDGVIVMDIVI